MVDEKHGLILMGTGSATARLIAEITGKDVGTCEIKDPITKVPNIEGPYGKAWKIDQTSASYTIKNEDDCTLAHWIIECPLANPIWHSYSLLLIHLKPIEGVKTTYYLDGATHELWLQVLNPEGDRRKLLEQGYPGEDTCGWLSPSNYASQIIEVEDQLAIKRIEEAVRMVCDGKLSPDTDHIYSWIALFGDNMVKKEYK